MTIIIDTDPGIDDAIAILYALQHPRLEVAALTTVAGNIGLSVTTRNAGRICALARVPTSVYAGAAAPLGKEPRPETGIHGNDGLGGVEFPEPEAAPASADAVAAMVALLEAHPPQTVDLHCLGPLTNLALLLERAPEVARRIRRVIAMGGAVDEPGNVGPKAEFNIAHDPHAAAAVLAAGLPLTLIPLDATRQLRADAAYIADLRATGQSPAIAAAALIEAYFAATNGAESRPLHDPCVPLLAEHPELFRIEERSLDVELDTGALVPGPHRLNVAMGLDADALRTALLEGLAR
ncbi:nucleoside hydrolase [Tropicimonas sediminicola]|uniref:Purine nucleosidase/pyrimidine-specific ribonucleoside hydrolase n=1 Tax=Tropicimonas sediminicola TaxID=1031541 RepID=A0A239L9G8_9RHOB|nr:nucleoside hydrolase [Tropicimonas sediminicola]SNT26154.1 purine nucleosidase/pyrimidine-specific ribonucleoside hydrolase [Tropicimonas sediminicola]